MRGGGGCRSRALNGISRQGVHECNEAPRGQSSGLARASPLSTMPASESRGSRDRLELNRLRAPVPAREVQRYHPASTVVSTRGTSVRHADRIASTMLILLRSRAETPHRMRVLSSTRKRIRVVSASTFEGSCPWAGPSPVHPPTCPCTGCFASADPEFPRFERRRWNL